MLLRPLAFGLGLVLAACAGQAPSAASCIEAWNESDGPTQALAMFAGEIDSTDVILRRWTDSEVEWRESGCSIAVTDRNTGVVVGTIDGNASMNVTAVDSGASLHDWSDRRSEKPLSALPDGTVTSG